jgi:hypothetical protein
MLKCQCLGLAVVAFLPCFPIFPAALGRYLTNLLTVPHAPVAHPVTHEKPGLLVWVGIGIGIGIGFCSAQLPIAIAIAIPMPIPMPNGSVEMLFSKQQTERPAYRGLETLDTPKSHSRKFTGRR